MTELLMGLQALTLFAVFFMVLLVRKVRREADEMMAEARKLEGVARILSEDAARKLQVANPTQRIGTTSLFVHSEGPAWGDARREHEFLVNRLKRRARVLGYNGGTPPSAGRYDVICGTGGFECSAYWDGAAWCEGPGGEVFGWKVATVAS